MSLDRIADIAESHVGDYGPTDTCMSNGLEKWTREAGLPGLDTGSVSEGIDRAQAGHNGWKYHDGTDGLARGHFAVWSHAALGSPNLEHVTCVTQVSGNTWHGVGSGTPSGRVAIQPASGGMNPKSVLRGYLIPPTAAAPAVKPAPVKPAASGDTYVVRKGDTLIKIARRHSTTWQKIAAANPPKGGKSTDFHILRPNLILIGQKIRIP